MRAVEVIAERLGAPVILRQVEIQSTAAIVKGLFQRSGDALFILRPKRETIDDNLQPCGRSLVDLVELADFALDEQPMETGLTQALPSVVPKRRRDGQRKRHHKRATLGESAELREYRLRAVAFDDPFTTAAVESSDLGEQQFEMVVQLQSWGKGI